MGVRQFIYSYQNKKLTQLRNYKSFLYTTQCIGTLTCCSPVSGFITNIQFRF